MSAPITSRDADAIVVGSGPAGVSVVPPLLDAGMRVLLVDGGRRATADLSPPGAYHDLRRGEAEQWRWFLGPKLEGLRRGGPPSPKFDAPGWRFAYEGFRQALGIENVGFAMVGSLAAGGLSHTWGAGLTVYDEGDLAEFPFTLADLDPSYRRVAERMGVSGFVEDDLATPGLHGLASQQPMELTENARRLLGRYERRRRRVQDLGVRLGRSRIAVLTEPRGDREACDLRDTCLWGCRRRAIWNASYDLDELRTHDRFDYRPGRVVSGLRRAGGGYELILHGDGAGPGSGGTLRAPILVLAAGALATTRLILELQQRYREPVPVLSSPAMAFALCLPERIGAALPERGFSLAQLSFVAGRDGERVYGNLFSAAGIPVSLVADRMALTRPAAVRVYRRLQPSLLLANCYLPATYYANTASLEPTAAGGSRLVVRGGEASPELRNRLARLQRQLGAAFRRLGAWMLPGSFTLSEAGSDLRPAGTLPMSADPGPGRLDAAGQLHGAPGLYVADLAGFPALSAKHPTFALMANADRMGGIIGRRWRRREA